VPVILRNAGFRFFFYSNEGDPREPIHVHVRKGGGEAKFWINPVSVAWSRGFDAQTLRQLTEAIENNVSLFERAWDEYFG
jgi:Domain of unknown function (DUF4160)